MAVSPTALPVVFALAAAVLALWCDARVPTLRPRRPLSYLLHLAAAVVAIELAALLIERVGSGREEVLAASLFAALLPAFVYAFLTSVWLLRAVLDPQRG